MDEITVSEACAEVKLQVLVDHDAKRVVHLLEQVTENCPLNNIDDGANIEFHHKWGTDGSGEHSEYKQAFSEAAPPDEDRCVLLTAISALHVKGS